MSNVLELCDVEVLDSRIKLDGIQKLVIRNIQINELNFEELICTIINSEVIDLEIVYCKIYEYNIEPPNVYNDGILKIVTNMKLKRLYFQNSYNAGKLGIIMRGLSPTLSSLRLTDNLSSVEWYGLSRHYNIIDFTCDKKSEWDDINTSKFIDFVARNVVRKKCIIVLGCKSKIPRTTDICSYRDLLRLIAQKMWKN